MTFETQEPTDIDDGLGDETGPEPDGTETGECAFSFLPPGQIGVSVDDEDNEANHNIPHHESGTKVSFGVVNVGTSTCSCEVTVFVDDQESVRWSSATIPPGAQDAPPGTFLNGIGRFEAGEHVFKATVDPAGAQAIATVENTVDIG